MMKQLESSEKGKRSEEKIDFRKEKLSANNILEQK